ncbi:MAG: tetratricopeptide repeat protein, partial [Chthoniobacteraceae bacterium]
FAYVSSNAEITFALGNVWFHRHDLARAKACYGETLRLTIQTSRPHDGALRNMGIIAIEEKRWSDAENFLTASLKIEPDSAKAYFLLARARHKSGNLPGAMSAIEEAIRLDGETPDFQKLRDDLRQPAPAPK